MRVLICGDRDWSDYALVKAVVATLPDDAVVIEGEARGADRQARIAARLRGLEVADFPADWDREGDAAGPLRNRRMLIKGRPDVVIWFHHHLPSSRGTRDMVKIARAAGVPTFSGAEWMWITRHVRDEA